MLGALIGQGGSGEVFRAQDRLLGRAVAIKVFPTGTDGSDDVHRWREARTLAGLDHPRLITIYDVGEHDARAFFVMQLVEGQSLAQRLEAGALTCAQTVQLGARLAAGLGYVHRHGVVHRDIKPANVLLDQTDQPYLADFGIATQVNAAAITEAGVVRGTAAYLAPEQVAGQPVGPAADVYALGLVLLECVTGRQEYPGDPVRAAVDRLHRPPQLPELLPEPLMAVLQAMTRQNPADRPTAQQSTADLQGLLAIPERALEVPTAM